MNWHVCQMHHSTMFMILIHTAPRTPAGQPLVSLKFLSTATCPEPSFGYPEGPFTPPGLRLKPLCQQVSTSTSLLLSHLHLQAQLKGHKEAFPDNLPVTSMKCSPCPCWILCTFQPLHSKSAISLCSSTPIYKPQIVSPLNWVVKVLF